MDKWNLVISGPEWNLNLSGEKTVTVLPTELRIAGEQAVEEFNGIGLAVNNAKIDFAEQAISLPHGAAQNTGTHTATREQVWPVAEKLVNKCRGFGLQIETAVLDFAGQKLNMLTGNPVHSGAVAD